MDSTLKKKPRTIAEMLPELDGLVNKEALRAISLTAKKTPRPTMVNTQTSERALKPMTLAQMNTVLESLQPNLSKKTDQPAASNKKKGNSSCKLDNKTVSRTANQQMKHNSVRKVLNFQPPKPKVPTKAIPAIIMSNTGTPTQKQPITKSEFEAKKSLYLKASNTVRISGISNIPETPFVINDKPTKSIDKSKRLTLVNKENVPGQVIVNEKPVATPKSILRKRLLTSKIPDTPLSNESCNSCCDESFLQNEKDIEFLESKAKALFEESLENIAEISPPMFTSLANYQNDKDFFNNSSDLMENMCHHNTVMSSDDKSVAKENSKREESVIVSLCDMLSKALVSNKEKQSSSDLDDLLDVQNQTLSNIKMIENGICMLKNIKESQLKTLQYVNKLIQEKKHLQTSESEKDNTVIETKESQKFDENTSPPCSVIKTMVKSPSYKIPKKNACMSNIFSKSMPNISGLVTTPQKQISKKALSMYLNMKEHYNFLNTPAGKQRPIQVPDTPAIISHNLQKQLDKLYSETH